MNKELKLTKWKVLKQKVASVLLSKVKLNNFYHAIALAFLGSFFIPIFLIMVIGCIATHWDNATNAVAAIAAAVASKDFLRLLCQV